MITYSAPKKTRRSLTDCGRPIWRAQPLVIFVIRRWHIYKVPSGNVCDSLQPLLKLPEVWVVSSEARTQGRAVQNAELGSRLEILRLNVWNFESRKGLSSTIGGILFLSHLEGWDLLGCRLDHI